MGMPIDNFRPVGSVLINATATSAATALPGPDAGGLDCDLVLFNSGPNLVFFALGIGTVVAVNTGADMVVPIGGTRTIQARRGETHIATICPAAGTAALYVSRGNGS